jgi:predicted nucleic acid-binding Zn ribbon protein
MKRVNTQSLGSALDEFLEQNPELADKLAETRLMEAWKVVLGTSISRFTGNMYIRNRALYVKLNSAVVKSELLLCREQLVKKLNAQAGRNVIDNIILN